jgi:hypothetical protein
MKRLGRKTGEPIVSFYPNKDDKLPSGALCFFDFELVLLRVGMTCKPCTALGAGLAAGKRDQIQISKADAKAITSSREVFLSCQ